MRQFVPRRLVFDGRIMPEIEGFKAWIEVEGFVLQEYGVDALGDEMGVTCWVPCETGKEFSIGVAIPESDLKEMGHKVRIRLDGVDTLLRGNIFQQHTPAPARRFSDQWVDAARSGTRAFQFGTLQLTDDDDYLDQSNEDLGEIQVAVQSVEKFVAVVPKEGGRFNDDSRVHEQSKKALATCVKFGETKVHDGAPPKNFVARGVKDVFTFVFKYRTMEVLIANEIAPRIVKRLTPIDLKTSPPRPLRKNWKAHGDESGEDRRPQIQGKRLKKGSQDKSTSERKEKVRKRARETPSWTDDSDDDPYGCARGGFRILSPLRK